MTRAPPPPPDDNDDDTKRDGLAAPGGAAQLAGWAVRGSPACGARGGGDGGGGVLPPAPPVRKTAWGAAGLASDGLSAEERELEAVLEASRVAEETRQREDAESKIAMDVSSGPFFFCSCFCGQGCSPRIVLLHFECNSCWLASVQIFEGLGIDERATSQTYSPPF